MLRSLIMRRPLVFRCRRHCIGIPTRLHDARQRLEPVAKGVDVALLAQNFIAEDRVCMVEKRDFGLESFERLGLQFGRPHNACYCFGILSDHEPATREYDADLESSR